MRDISKLLKPKKIAVIGASEKDGFGGDTCRTILSYTKDLSKVYFINPKRDEIFGQKCYHTVAELPTDIDLAIICTPQSIVESLLKEAAQKGCKGAVVFASNYGETGPAGKEREASLCKICDELGIALMGPNCAGFANYIDDVYSFAFLTEKRERCGNIGMVSQSGQVCLSGLDSPGMKFSYLISSGNSAHLRVEEYMSFLVDDEDTKVVCCYIEGVVHTDIFVDALKRAALKRKPVIILKSGRSNKAAMLAASHTGSLSGSDKAFDAAIEKYNAIRVDDLQELLATAQLFSVMKEYPTKPVYASLNVSGGESGITADAAFINDIELADFSDETLAKLKEIMPEYATASNPLDMTATLAYDPEKMAQAIKIISADQSVGALIIGYTIPLDIIDTTPQKMVEGVELALKENVKPLIWMPFVEHTKNPELHDKLLSLNVPITPATLYGYKVLQNLNKFISYNPEDHRLEFKSPKFAGESIQSFSEFGSLTLLEEAGIDVGKMFLVESEDELEKACKELGFPVVLKIDSPDILHKSDVGGVKLNLKTIEDAKNAYHQILENAKKHCPHARDVRILVKEMSPAGMEMIVGVNNDDQFGPIIMIGLGGIFVEVFKDVQLAPAPLNKNEAIKMIERLKGYKLLNGYRGGKVADIDACADFVVKISEYAYANVNKLKELDVNPLFVYENGQGVCPADGLIVFKQ